MSDHDFPPWAAWVSGVVLAGVGAGEWLRRTVARMLKNDIALEAERRKRLEDTYREGHRLLNGRVDCLDNRQRETDQEIARLDERQKDVRRRMSKLDGMGGEGL